MLLLAILVALSLQFFSGTPWAKMLLYCFLGLGGTIMAVLWKLASSEREFRGWYINVAWAVALGATLANTIFFGIYSPAPVVSILAIIMFAQGESIALARGAVVAAILVETVIGGLDLLTLMKDPGIVSLGADQGLEKVVGQTLVVSLILAAYHLGRTTRLAAAEAIEKMQAAARLVEERNLMAREAREDLARALNIGGRGRLSEEVVGDYSLKELIGSGGMGEIYRAVHTASNQDVAIKVIHPYLYEDSHFEERFLRESRLCRALDSPHIVKLLSSGTCPHGPYMVLEYLRGESLSAFLSREGKMPMADVLRLAQHIAAGLAEAAKHQIVHRDLKPQNIFLAEERAGWTAKILDFGVARTGHAQTLTHANALVGTPAYMAPEQAKGDRVDHRADVFSMAVVLYRTMSGSLPFDSDNVHTLLYAIVHEEARKISDFDLPTVLDPIFQKALAKNCEDRFQSADLFAKDLIAALRG
jgi:tRNA A-37 threonylcarbamoyl transferase component Bud32